MSTEKINLYWTHGTIDNALCLSINELCDEFGHDISHSYLEWRPGSGLLLDNIGQAPVLLEGKPEHDNRIQLDELRFFSLSAGLHAVDDGKKTRWMKWQIDKPDSHNCKEVKVIRSEKYSILLMSTESANRFGLSSHFESNESFYIQEFLHNGELFCWTLVQGDSNDFDKI